MKALILILILQIVSLVNNQSTSTKSTTKRSTTPAPTTVSTTTEIPSSSGCFCVPTNSCIPTAGGNSTDGNDDNSDHGDGKMDVRAVRIINTNRDPPPSSGTNQSIVRPASSGIPLATKAQTDCRSINENLEGCCPKDGYQCGLSYPPLPGTKSYPGRAYLGEFPWQGIIFSTPSNTYIGSAVLIDQRHLLTIAHNLYGKNQTYKVRLGEWDTTSKDEQLPYFESSVSKIMFHPNFTKRNLHNDIAVLRLENGFNLGQYPHVGIACLPDKPINQPITCFISGWGTNDFNYGQTQAIQRKVDVPIVVHSKCEETLRMTKLGKYFKLHPGFMCAGGVTGKDACTGDAGAPLVCKVVNQWYAVGLVSWGLNCGGNIPSIYMNIPYYLPWIQESTASPN